MVSTVPTGSYRPPLSPQQACEQTRGNWIQTPNTTREGEDGVCLVDGGGVIIYHEGKATSDYVAPTIEI